MKEKKDIKGDYLSYMHALKVFTLSDVIDLSDNKNQNYIYKQISDMMQFNQILKSDQILEKDELDVYMDVLNNLIRLLDYNIDSLSKIKIRPEIENEILY